MVWWIAFGSLVWIIIGQLAGIAEQASKKKIGMCIAKTFIVCAAIAALVLICVV